MLIIHPNQHILPLLKLLHLLINVKRLLHELLPNHLHRNAPPIETHQRLHFLPKDLELLDLFLEGLLGLAFEHLEVGLVQL